MSIRDHTAKRIHAYERTATVHEQRGTIRINMLQERCQVTTFTGYSGELLDGRISKIRQQSVGRAVFENKRLASEKVFPISDGFGKGIHHPVQEDVLFASDRRWIGN
jgi:hypothetical protein